MELGVIAARSLTTSTDICADLHALATMRSTDLLTLKLAREVAPPYGPRTANGPSSVRKHD